MRLIDADKLIEEMRKWYWDDEKQKAVEENESPMDLFTNLAILTVKEQPTAYDVDKVVQQLDDRSTLSRPVGWTKFYQIMLLKDAIKIVKDGEGRSENRKEWLNSEYVEPEVDWSKVPIDTPILVRVSEDEEWDKRYFAGFNEKKVCAWSDGATSWSADGENDYYEWEYAKIAEDEKQSGDNGWHNLKDKKPEDKQEVLTWDGLGVHEDRWSDDADYFESTDAEEIWWRAMPEPPEV